MKRPIPITLTLTILCLPLFLGALRLWLPATTVGGPLPALKGEAALNHLKEQGLYGSLQEAVTAARYGLYQGSKQRGDWLANNPAQRLRARFTTDGLQVETRGAKGRSHRLGMKLRSAGYGERQIAVKAGRLTASGARAEIHYELRQSEIREPQSAIIEWYHNTAAGLEQGFTIGSAPGERRDGEWLRVALAIEGELRAEAVEGGQALEFRDDAGRRALRYDHLVVRDAEGRELEARMTAPEQDEVWLEVDDREAVWPVAIDPTFTQQQKLEASDAGANDRFGDSVAISGETVVIGARFDDSAAGLDQGSAYVFARSGTRWTQQQKLLASDAAAGDDFGVSVAISGETVVIGATGADGAAGLNQGSAYVFVRSGTRWRQQQKLLASDAASRAGFGLSVAISGETVVVGAAFNTVTPGFLQGSAYVFARSGTRWTQQQKLLASDAATDDLFGWSVAISGETIVVGALRDDGEVGANQGSAYVFARSGTNWTQQQKLLASDAAEFDQFGASVAISGETIVIGAADDDRFAGSAYVFARSGTNWMQQQKLLASDAAAGARFGHSVAISGETIVVGARLDDGAAGLDQGSAYVFARSGTRWTQQQKLQASDAAAGDVFGWSVAISGEMVVVGAPDDDGVAVNQGSAFVFVSKSADRPGHFRPSAPGRKNAPAGRPPGRDVLRLAHQGENVGDQKRSDRAAFVQRRNQLTPEFRG